MTVCISPQELLRVTTQCLKSIEEYNGEDDKEITYKEFSLLKLRYVSKSYIRVPLWTYSHCGIVTRLNELKVIAENVLQDNYLKDKDTAIKLSQTTYYELYKLLNKASNFEPYVFGRGY